MRRSPRFKFMSRHSHFVAFMCRATHLSLHSCVASLTFGRIHVSRHISITQFMCRATQASRRSCATPHTFRRIHVSSYDGRLEGIHFKKHSVGYLRVNNDTQKDQIFYRWKQRQIWPNMTNCTQLALSVRKFADEGVAPFYIRKVLGLNPDSDIGYSNLNSCFFSDTPSNRRSSASTRVTIATSLESVICRSSHHSTLQSTSAGNTVINHSP